MLKFLPTTALAELGELAETVSQHFDSVVGEFETYNQTYNESLLSGQKSNKINWLEMGAGWFCASSACKAHETWVFSKTETDKICRQV